MPALGKELEPLKERAAAVVAAWAERFDVVTGESKQTAEETEAAKQKEKKLLKRPVTTVVREKLIGWKNWIKKKVMVGLSAHAVISILMSKHSDSFSVGDKIFVQANVFVMMLAFAIGFYYSKSTNCCIERKV